MRKLISLKSFLAVAAVFFVVFSLTGLSFAGEIDDVRAAIKTKNAKWSAAETTIHKMDGLKRKMRAGLTLPTTATTTSNQSQTKVTYLLSAPTGGFDWRNNGGSNYVTAVKDQGNCGSCWAFATTGALESYTLIHGIFDTNKNLSEQILVSCSGAGSCNGGYLDSASTFIQHTGLPAENMDPYTATNSACSTATANWTGATDKIAVWGWISNGTPAVATIKDSVFTYGPVIASMQVYSDFYAYGSGVYSHTGGSYQGGHAILIVGYADDASMPGGGYFIVKNSWGTGWGEGFGNQAGGYFRIAYSELQSSVQFGMYTIAYDTATTACTYAVSPTTNTISSSGGTGNIAVMTGSTCTWIAKSNSTWLSATPGAATKGNGSISYVATANTGTSSRKGTITLFDSASNTVSTFIVTQQAPVATYTISGTIHSGSTTGPALAGATISIAGKTATTSSTGTFSLSGIAAGTYTLGIAKTGYTSYANTAFSVTSNLSVNLFLSQPTFTFSGKVRDGASGAMLAGVTVSYAGKTTTTSSTGTFSLGGITAGTYPLSFAKTGYTPYNNTSYSISASQVVALDLMPAPVAKTYAVTGVTHSGSVTGPVLAGVTVTLAGKTAITNNAGAFTIAGIPSGTYTIALAKTGYVSRSNSNLVVTGNVSANYYLLSSTANNVK